MVAPDGATAPAGAPPLAAHEPPVGVAGCPRSALDTLCGVAPQVVDVTACCDELHAFEENTSISAPAQVAPEGAPQEHAVHERVSTALS